MSAASFTDAEIAAATGGALVHPGPAGTLCTDSRTLAPGQWFVALSGARFDGSAFLDAVRARGAAGAIGPQAPEGWDRGFVAVSDPLAALQSLARAARARFSGPVVGITGTAGKTTTRALTMLALSGLGPVGGTQGNLNNEIGVPLSVLGASPADAAWVLEMGMNGFGQIHLLQSIGLPTVRCITNVGAGHTEGVGSVDGVAKAKGELFVAARPGDTVCVNLDDRRVRAIPLPAGVRVVGWGRDPAADIRLREVTVRAADAHTVFTIDTPDGVVESEIAAPGEHLALCATAAVAIAVAAGAPVAGMGERLRAYAPVGMRARLEDGPRGTRVINDAYNANPLSVAASLRTLAALAAPRRIALLGDMLELGPVEAAGHADTLDLALSLGLDLVGVAGPRFSAAAAGRAGVLAAPDAATLAHALRPLLQPGDLLLIKGSRGLGMEALLSALSAEPA